MNFPSFSQWKQIFKVLKKSEKIALTIFSTLAIISLVFLVTHFYVSNTHVVPALGGTYKEGIVGQPRFINPVYGETNDVDRTLINLVFSGLMTYDKDGGIVKDLAENYTILDDGKTYNFQLKDNVFWHDGKPVTSDDVLFTIKTIQNSDYKSPLRANWIDVDVEKISDKSLKFKLKVPYNSFLENVTVKILPKHIWASISPESFILSSYNLQPIGSGPYKFSDINQLKSGFIQSVDLKNNQRYYGNVAPISNVSFHFFDKKEDLIKSLNSKNIDGFTLASLENDLSYVEKNINQGLFQSEKLSKYYFSLPRYFAVFFNLGQKSSIFSDENIRKALSYAVNIDELITNINSEFLPAPAGAKTDGQAGKNNISKVDSPIIPEFFGYEKPTNSYNFDIEKARSLLDKAGFKVNGRGQREKSISKKPAFQFKSYLKIGSKGTEVIQLQSCLARLDETLKNMLASETNGTFGKSTDSAVTDFQKKYLPDKNPTGEVGESTRKKLNELCVTPSPDAQQLKFTLTTINQPQLLKVANLLATYWQEVGVQTEINAVSITDLKPIIKNRNYEALLYGEALGSKPDLYPFWHSSQKLDPGLNLSSYDNKDADKLLKEARETLDESVKQRKYEKLQDIIINNAPALFLYNPDYIYMVSEKIKGIETSKIIDPAKRFSNVSNWYIKTKRVWR